MPISTSRPPLPMDGLPLVLSLPHGRLPAAGDHPDRELLRQRHDDWFRAQTAAVGMHAERRLFEECEGVSLMCRVLPGADGERLLGICLAASVLFLLDDVTDGDSDETSHADRYLAVLAGAGTDGGSAPLQLLGRTLARVRDGVSPELWSRFVAGFSEVIRTAAVKSSAPVPDYAGYLAVRRADAAFDLVGVAIEHGLGLERERGLSLPPGALDRLLDVCFEHTILVNDLLSYRKEYALDEPMNALGVLLRTEGLGLQEAVDALCGRLALIEDAFFDECAVLRAGYGGQPGMAPYLDAWGLMLSGNMAWSLRCPRYHGAGGGWDWQQGAPELMELFPDRTVFSATSRGRVPAMG